MRDQILHAAARATSQDHDIVNRFTFMQSYLDGVMSDGVSDIFDLFAEGQASKHDPQAQQRNTHIPQAKDPHANDPNIESTPPRNTKSTAHSDRTEQRSAPATRRARRTTCAAHDHRSLNIRSQAAKVTWTGTVRPDNTTNHAKLAWHLHAETFKELYENRLDKWSEY